MKIGPFPKGMPVGLMTNMDLLGDELPPAEREAHRKKLLTLREACEGGAEGRARTSAPSLAGLVDDMLDVSKCKDFVVNKGHYFGTDYFTEEPGLSDADKRALIAFLKTF